MILLLFVPQVASAAWGGGFQFASGGISSVGNSLVLTTADDLLAGQVGICAFASDEGDETDGNRNYFNNVVDSAGNTWIEAAEWCNAGNATPLTGACTGIYYTKATSTLATGGTVTLSANFSTGIMAGVCAYFTVSAGAIISKASVEASGENAGGSAPSSLSITGVANREHLFLRTGAAQTNGTNWSPISSGFSTCGTGVGNTGSTGSSQSSWCEYIVQTGTSSSTSSPTTPTAVGVGYMLGFDETVPATGWQMIIQSD